MKVAGIITEYNPFHKGHQYHIERTRALTGADYVIAVMSGSFVQRGEPALLDKYTRAKMALLCGADLVLELPVCFSAGSAGDFAAGAVSLLDRLGVVDFLCFGSECGSTAPLTQAAALLADEPPAFSAALQKRLKAGLPFPRARAEALKACLAESAAASSAIHPAAEEAADAARDDDTDIASLLCAPNNILGLEYCLALQKRHSSILPVTLRRKGAGYHEEQLCASFPLQSASAIRSAVRKKDTALLRDALSYAVPAAAMPLWHTILTHDRMLLVDDFTKELRLRLLSEASSGFTRYADVSRELSDKLRKQQLFAGTWTSLCETLKSKELTYSRISRCLCHILLSITAEELVSARQADYAAYARILGFRKEAQPLLSAIKKSSTILLLSKLADAHRLLSPDALHMLKQDILAAHIWESALSAKTGAPPHSEYTRQIVLL